MNSLDTDKCTPMRKEEEAFGGYDYGICGLLVPYTLIGMWLSKIWADVQVLVEPNCRALRDYCLRVAEKGKETLHEKIKSKLNEQLSLLNSSFCLY